jgi:hypothetical protein
MKHNFTFNQQTIKATSPVRHIFVIRPSLQHFWYFVTREKEFHVSFVANGHKYGTRTTAFPKLLWHVGPLLDNNRKISSHTTAATATYATMEELFGELFSMRSV